MNAAIIVAAGQGLRMGASQRKQFLLLDHLPILAHTLKVFDDSSVVDRIVLVVPEDEKAYCDREIVRPARLKTRVQMVAGGRQRQNSVFNGLKTLEGQASIVLVHDGVRPLVSGALIEACIAGAEKWGACTPGLPVVDTLKQADENRCVRHTVSRAGLYAVQTPQAFRFSVIMAAHDAGLTAGAGQATDDAALVEVMGKPVHIIPGERENIKITTPEDLAIAKAYLQARQAV